MDVAMFLVTAIVIVAVIGISLALMHFTHSKEERLRYAPSRSKTIAVTLFVASSGALLFERSSSNSDRADQIGNQPKTREILADLPEKENGKESSPSVMHPVAD